MSKKMQVCKAKIKCMVRGCDNTSDTYAVTLTREKGHSIIICHECAKKLLPAIDEFKAALAKQKRAKLDSLVQDNMKQNDIVQDESASTDSTNTESTENDLINTELKCKYCGRICGSEIGLMSHEKACKNKIQKQE